MSKQCHGKTKTGRQCTKKVLRGTFCFHHKNQEAELVVEPKPEGLQEEQSDDECPICLEPDLSKLKFSCGHAVCLTCLKQLRQSLCPLCRRDISLEIPNHMKWHADAPPQPQMGRPLPRFEELQAQLPRIEDLIRIYGELEAFEVYMAMLMSLGFPQEGLSNLALRRVPN